MDFSRLSWGEWLAAAAGVLMLVALFLPWYSAGGEESTAWEAMALDDILLAITALLAIGAAIFVGVRRVSSLSVATTSLALMPAAVCLVLTIYRLVSPAPPGDVSLEIGAWLALAAALGIVIGAWNGAKDEGPARRNPEAERRGTEAGLARSEVLTLPTEGTGNGPAPVGADPSG